MKTSLSIQLLTCLMLYASSAHAIMVKFGTKNGPIEPPTPEPLPTPQPYRAPAPVWEPRSDDVPDPNAQWRPQQLFFPQPRYTQVVFGSGSLPPAQNSAQRFVNAYRTSQPNARPVSEYVNPSQILSSQSLPGFGIRYFVPTYINEYQARKEEKRQEDSKHNDIETNNISDSTNDSSADLLWKYEKDSTKRLLDQAVEETARPVYQWPAYVHPRH